MYPTVGARHDRRHQTKKRDRTHWLYIAVIIAVVAGIAVGLLAPDVGKALGVLGTVFVSLIKMMIAPVIFCTIVLGIGSVRKAAHGGQGRRPRLGLLPRRCRPWRWPSAWWSATSSSPGTGLNIAAEPAGKGAKLAEKAQKPAARGVLRSTSSRPRCCPALTEGNVLQTLFVALLVGFALQAMGKAGEPILRASVTSRSWCSGSSPMILWLAPIGAFGAIANVVGATGFDAVNQLGVLMLAFYITCVIFVFGVLGTLPGWSPGSRSSSWCGTWPASTC